MIAWYCMVVILLGVVVFMILVFRHTKWQVHRYVEISEDRVNPDGSHTVTLRCGHVFTYRVAPRKFWPCSECSVK